MLIRVIGVGFKVEGLGHMKADGIEYLETTIYDELKDVSRKFRNL